MNVDCADERREQENARPLDSDQLGIFEENVIILFTSSHRI